MVLWSLWGPRGGQPRFLREATLDSPRPVSHVKTHRGRKGECITALERPSFPFLNHCCEALEPSSCILAPSVLVFRNETIGNLCCVKDRLHSSVYLGLNPRATLLPVPQLPYLLGGDNQTSLKRGLGGFLTSWMRETCLASAWACARCWEPLFLPPFPPTPISLGLCPIASLPPGPAL